MNYMRSRYTVLVGSGETAYLFNTSSGGLIQMGVAEQEGVALLFQALEMTGSIPENLGRVGDFLIDNGFIVEAEIDEVALAISNYDTRRAGKDFLSLTIATTMRCNMGCHYCFEDRTTGQSLGATDVPAIAQFASQRMPAQGLLSVNWFGGEPLLQMDFVREASAVLTKVAEERGGRYKASMTTNAFLLEPHVAAELKQLGVVALQATLDGAQEKHDAVRRHKPEGGGKRIDTYRQVLRNIASASESLAVSVRVNVSRQNLRTLDRMLEDLAEAGLAPRLARIYFAPLFNYKVNAAGSQYRPSEKVHFGMREFAEAEVDLIAKASALGFRVADWANSQYGGCIAVSENGFVIDANGEVKKCDHEIGDSSTAILSLRQDDSATALKKSVFDDYRPENNTGCPTCVLLPVCYSFCPHKHLEAGAERVEQCPSYKYNWERTLPTLLAQRYQRRVAGVQTDADIKTPAA